MKPENLLRAAEVYEVDIKYLVRGGPRVPASVDKPTFKMSEELTPYTLTPRQRVLVDLYEGLTEAQQEEFFRELEKTKQDNEALYEEPSRKRKQA